MTSRELFSNDSTSNRALSTPFANQIPSELKNFDFLVQWIEFVADRKERRNRLTSRSAGILLRTLAQRPKEAEKALETAIKKGWLTIEWEWIDRTSQKQQPKTGRAASDSMKIG